MKKIIALLTLIVCFGSCKKQDEIGPDINAIYGPVTITQPFSVSATTVDFSMGSKLYFNASFQNDASWVITIKGTNSNAIKTIHGVGKTINVSNSIWDGSADSPPSFSLETVTATLTFKYTPEVFTSDPVTISGKFISGSSTDVLVTDFLVSKVQNYGAVAIPPTMWPSDFPVTTNTITTYGLPDGNAYETMGPNAAWQGAGSPYIDVISITPYNSIVNYGTYYPLYSDPSKVYFNIMVYNTGTPTWLSIAFSEEGIVSRKIDIKPNWTGWKLVSLRYSDLVAITADAALNVQPQKITGIQIILLSNLLVTSPALTTTPVSAAFDHIIFTHNTPYQP